MARDGLFFRQFATLHPRFRTPVTALVAQGAWAVALLLSGSYGALLDWVTFADWIFFGLTAATLIVYRRRDRSEKSSDFRDRTRGFRAPMWPVTVSLFLLAAVYVVIGAVVSNPGNALRGTLVLLAGIPVYTIWRRSPRV